MASTKLQKPTNEEHKFTQKISEVTAWGGRVFRHKQQEHQAVAKRCTTCQCSASKDTKPKCTHIQKKERADTIPVKNIKYGVCTETKEEKEEHSSTVNKDAKHTTCIELRKKAKQHTTNVQIKDSKQPAHAEMRKKEKEQHAKSNTANACNKISNKVHIQNKEEPTNHCFSTMADHWKERMMMMKKPKEGKCKDSSSSSDSNSEDESCGIMKTDKRVKRHSQGTKTSSK
ncbi:uncharacterized protein LOC110719666 [Chenopodium quinoa]|uniref:uncharacterized protein LOC110719666 n=1 Tax=Chenopodium quinoa TaxID=63459 RepID=UPI000B781677|nr:uncharacterized protein LOC110719666 [Chenopodium quinoa]